MGEAFSTARQYTSRAVREAQLAEATPKRSAALQEFISDPLPTLAEVGQALGGLPIGTLRDWTREGRLRCVRVGRR